MVSSTSAAIQVARGADDMYQEIASIELVPGDVILVPANNFVMGCDAVLLDGAAVANESMLTGESVPVTKTPLQASDEELFDMDIHKRSILFAGSKVCVYLYIFFSRSMQI